MAADVCPFCEIVAGRAPATIVRSWFNALAIVPLNPVVDGHVLVIPKEHVTDFTENPRITSITMFHAAELASDMDQPMNLITSKGHEAGQSVEHLAIELIPREEQAGAPLTPRADGYCPVCFQPRVRRERGELGTCGDPACSYELRARRLRGNVYGDTGGGPEPSEEITYNAAHSRARKQLRGQECAEADSTCFGRLEAALRPDLPTDMLRVRDYDGALYYTGLDATVGYRNLCRSHHSREGHLVAALKRYPELQSARIAEWARKGHTECDSGCAVCSALAAYDTAVSSLTKAVEAANDGLALPWYSGKSRKRSH